MDFFQENHIFCTFLSKIRKITKNPFLDMCLYVISWKFGHFELKAVFVSLSQKFLTKKVVFCHFLKKIIILSKI